MIFIDTNAVIDLIADGHDLEWPARQLVARDAPLACNLIVVAELAAGLQDADTLLSELEMLSIAILELDAATAFRAATAHREYRRRGGARSTILPDFLIAAHAATLGADFITRDRRLASYFPELTLITPDTHP